MQAGDGTGRRGGTSLALSTGMATRWRSVGITVTPGSGDGRARGIARRLARVLRRRGSAVTIETFGDLGLIPKRMTLTMGYFSNTTT